MKVAYAAVIVLGAMSLPLHAADVQPAAEGKPPVAIARTGFTPSQAREFRERYSYEVVISAGDVSLFHSLNSALRSRTLLRRDLDGPYGKVVRTK